MNRWLVLTVRTVIVLLMSAGVLLSGMMAFLVVIGPDDDDFPPRRFLAVVLLAFLAALTILVCVWKLLTMATRNTVFSPRSFRYVDVVIAGFTLISLLIVVFAGLVAGLNRGMPESEQAAPGLVLMIGGVGLAVLGVALVVLVMRTLLAQAISMHDELEGVI